MNETELIETALKKFKDAKRIAVENFVSTAPDNAYNNRANLRMDARLYKWNEHTQRAIIECLKALGKY